MPTIDETYQTMFGMGRMNPMTMLQIFREINSILSMFKSKSGHAAESIYNFTGQHTDIAFVAENGKLNASEIEKIPDKQLRENVQKSFSEAVQDGYLDFDSQRRDFTLTQKGMEHINSEAFMTQFEKDQRGQIAGNRAEVMLTGSASDLNVFRFTDSINLQSLASTYPSDSERILKYFAECEKYGFIHVSDGIATPTEKCLAYLEQNPMKDFEIRKVSPDNLEQVVDKVIERQVANFYDYEQNGKINAELKAEGAVEYKNITAEQAEYLRSVKGEQGLRFAIFDAVPDTGNKVKIGGYNIVFAKTDSDKFSKLLTDLESRKQREQMPKQSKKEVPRNVLENTFENVAFGAETAKKTVDFASGNSTGSDAAAESARMAAQQGANHLRTIAEKKAREQAAKRAAASASAKAAAKAGTTAAAGAASMGIGAAVSVVIDLTAKGANTLTNLNTQTHRQTLHRRG